MGNMGIERFPLKRSVSFRHNVTVRVERDLYDKIHKLKEMGLDTADFMRNAIRDAIKQAVDYADRNGFNECA